jgi:hypothetical protein
VRSSRTSDGRRSHWLPKAPETAPPMTLTAKKPMATFAIG